jgi:hypothetical protein
VPAVDGAHSQVGDYAAETPNLDAMPLWLDSVKNRRFAA